MLTALALPLPIAQAAPGGGTFGFLLPMLLIGLITYFMIIRPQSRREKTRRTMIETIKKGDKVVTIGGVHGSVVKVEDVSVLVQVDDNTKLRLDKNAIASIGAKDAKEPAVREADKAARTAA